MGKKKKGQAVRVVLSREGLPQKVLLSPVSQMPVLRPGEQVVSGRLEWSA